MKNIIRGLLVLSSFVAPTTIIACAKKTDEVESDSWATLQAIRQFNHIDVDLDFSSIKSASDFKDKIREDVIEELLKEKEKYFEGVTIEYYFKEINGQVLTINVKAVKGAASNSRNVRLTGKVK